jgi:hypothetical protein
VDDIVIRKKEVRPTEECVTCQRYEISIHQAKRKENCLLWKKEYERLRVHLQFSRSDRVPNSLHYRSRRKRPFQTREASCWASMAGVASAVLAVRSNHGVRKRPSIPPLWFPGKLDLLYEDKANNEHTH